MILDKPIKFKVEGIRDYDKDPDGDFILTVEAHNEQPTGTLIVDKSIVLRDNVDKSLIDTSDLSGIQFRLTAKEDMIDMADNSVIYKAGEEIGIYNLSKEGKLEITQIPMGCVELQEIKTLEGLLLYDTKYEIRFEQKDNTTKVYTQTLEIKNETTCVEFSKVDITGDKELIGAGLEIKDENNNLIDSWTSTEETHKIEGLEVGKSYTMTESIVVDGYVKATDIKFTVLSTNEIQKVQMIDKIVEVSKVDIAGKEIVGATLKVIDKDKNIVDKWVSEETPHKVKGLVEGETYWLEEEITVGSYVKATTIEFTVTSEKETQKIEMIDKIVLVSKIDSITSNHVADAHLKVVDEEGNIIDSWVSTNEPHEVVGLEENKKYWLIEEKTPYGYLQAEKIEFVVTEDKETQKIVMKDMPILRNIKVVKLDSETNEIIKGKFKFGIYEDSECTKLIQEVESNKKEGTVEFKDIRCTTVYIKEITAPSGYYLSDKVVKVELTETEVIVDGNILEDDNNIVVNYYNKQIPKIQTGNEMNYGLLIGSVIISLLGITTGIVVLKKNKKKNN